MQSCRQVSSPCYIHISILQTLAPIQTLKLVVSPGEINGKSEDECSLVAFIGI